LYEFCGTLKDHTPIQVGRCKTDPTRIAIFARFL
jgi:hypothetical protein